MKKRSILFAAVFALVAVPLFVGFAGPDAAAGKWDRLPLDGGLLLRSLFSMRVARADDDSAPYSAYREALNVLKTEYYGDRIDTKKSKELTYAAVRGMLYSLNDPFTSFLDPEEWLQMQQTTRGDFDGVGAVLEPVGQDVRVVRPIPDSPAFRAGVKPKDTIVSVTNYETGKPKITPTLGKNINDVVKLIKGPKGTRVDVTVMRKGHNGPLTFKLVRAHIEPPIVQYWMEDPQAKIGHILLNEFNEKSDAQFEHAYDALKAQGMRALVFDLRYNPGGLLNVAVEIGSRFVRSGPVVVIQEKSGQQEQIRRRQRELVDVPLAVLINENSASASEIVAGAIKDDSAGTLVGEHTFGKGLVQTLFPLDDGSALRLTTAKYFTPKMHDINNKYDEEHRPIFGTGGIKPDKVVSQPDDFDSQDTSDENRKKDVQLKAALDVLRTKLAQATPGRATP